MELPSHYNFKNKLGMRFGKLVVIEFAGRRNGVYYWKCECDCGETTTVLGSNLTPKRTKSCGCNYNLENIKPRVPVENRIAELEDKTAYSVIDPLSGKSNYKWLLHCPEHGEFLSVWNNVVNKGYGCPKCCKYGFQRGKSSYLYILSVYSEGDLLGYKIGITSQNPATRRYQINRKSSYDVFLSFSFKFDLGEDALDLETMLLRSFSANLFDKQDFQEGHTETIKTESLSEVLRITKDYHFRKHRII